MVWEAIHWLDAAIINAIQIRIVDQVKHALVSVVLTRAQDPVVSALNAKWKSIIQLVSVIMI